MCGNHDQHIIKLEHPHGFKILKGLLDLEIITHWQITL